MSRATGTLRREASPRRLRTTLSSSSTETVRGAVSGLDWTGMVARVAPAGTRGQGTEVKETRMTGDCVQPS
jgi:hypothetical protein